MAKVLVRIPGVDLARTVRMIDRLGVVGHPAREIWQAMALCGEDGLVRLEQAVADEPDPNGAGKLLYEAAPDRGVTALRDRIVRNGHAVESSDCMPLRHFDENDVRVLIDRFTSHPDRSNAQLLGWTGHDLARAELLDGKWRGHPDPAAREAVVNGLRALCPRRPDKDADLAIIGFLTDDLSPTVRLTARNTAEIRAHMFPSVQVWLDQAVPEQLLLEDTAVNSSVEWTSDVVADRLRNGGSGLRMALELVRQRPDLLAVGEIKDLVDRVANETLAGTHGIEVIYMLHDLLGMPFVQRCTAALNEDRSGVLHPLALSLSLKVSGDEDVYTAVAQHFARFPEPIAQPALANYRLPPTQRAHHLVDLLESLRAPHTEAVRMWAGALQDLQISRLDADEQGLRRRIASVTEHLLSLLPERTKKAPE
ncbi:hypothetical protein ACFWN2_25845 [Lentzea sp. NPDC058436]|uniref:hypothetical protein n=1 Tax=Lentzea sp. NPDC058436 TaxID=3346499 RepID=UPI00365A0BE4